VHVLFLVYFVNFIYNLYMFRTSLGPSLGGTTVFMRHLVLVMLYSWLSGMHPAYQRVKYQVSHLYSCPSWWWNWGGAKHVDVIKKLTKYTKNKTCTKLVSFKNNRIIWEHVAMATIRTSGWKYCCMSEVKKTRSWLKLTQEEVKRKIVNLQTLFTTEFVTLIKKGL
jgi:hypothetical protein